MSISQILALVDFSEGSNTALATAREIARKHGAALHLVHAVGPRGIVPASAFDEHRRVATDRLGEVLEKLTAEGISATAEVQAGSPLAAFEVTEDRCEPDLVVVGARGASPLRSLLVGSVARAVVEHAFAPVLVVRGAGVPFERVLVASDFSADAAAAAAVARAIAKPSAELHVAHVDAVPYESVAALGSVAVEKRRRESLARVEAEALALDATAHLATGRPAPEIVALSRRLDCDLIALGTQGEGRRSRFEGGSVARAVLRRAHASVLVRSRSEPPAALHEPLEQARDAAYTASLNDDERPGIVETLRTVKRLADDSRALESELLRDALDELERIAADSEREHPNLAAALSALVRALARMGI